MIERLTFLQPAVGRVALGFVALAVTTAIFVPRAGAQENLGDSGPEDTYFSFTFSKQAKLRASMPVEVATVAGPQSEGADLEFSPSVYAVSLSYGMESPSGKLAKPLVVRTAIGQAGETKVVRAMLTQSELGRLRAAARNARKRTVFVLVEGIALRTNRGNPGRVKRGSRLYL